jgi:hypothetical protein
MKTYGGVDEQMNVFLTPTLAGGECSASRPCRFTPGEGAPSTHWIRGWVEPRTDLNDMEKWKFFTLQRLVQPIASRRADWATALL